MARIAGVNLPTNKRVVIALQYIHGIGPKFAREICQKVGIPDQRRVNDLTDAEVSQIREAIDRDYVVEGDLRILDLAWPLVLVCAEFDGYLPHVRTRRVFDDDRKRQNDLVDAQWKVFRITSPMLTNDPRRAFAPIVRAVNTRAVSHV